ncbi:MAG: winged helix-turn-helix domain-containing protein [archaeon]|nr:winged helix-turn-helix domain-containing protein [archaeon]
MRRVIWWLIVGTKGGVNRARIIRALKERPYNANQLTELLGLDYKTVRHHIKVLQDNKIIAETGKGYGVVYFLSPEMEAEYEVFKGYLDNVWNKYMTKKIEDRG